VSDRRAAESLASAYDRVAAHLVGREHELTLALAAVAAGRDLILEGPPGTKAEDRLVMIEKWASREALDAHSRGTALAALNPQLAGKVNGPPDVITLAAVPAGDPAKGQL
jgi:hypothetical protein